MADSTSSSGSAEAPAAAESAACGAEELKKQGNVHFVEGQYAEAAELYSQAIALAPTNHLLYGNRCACRLQLSELEAALGDVEEALNIEPKWVKGHFRRGAVLMEMQRFREAHASFKQAAKHERRGARNAELQGKLNEAARKAAAADRRLPVQSLEDWMERFSAINDVRWRLGTLAHFWNSCEQTERHFIFSHLLTLIGGSSATASAATAGSAKIKGRAKSKAKAKAPPPTSPPQPASFSGEQFSASKMVALPMKNYGDIEFPAVWTQYFTSMEPAEKLGCMEAMYKSCSEVETRLVLQDLSHFMRPDAAGSSCTAAAAAAAAPAADES